MYLSHLTISEPVQVNSPSTQNNQKAIGIAGSRTSKTGVSLGNCGGGTGVLLTSSELREKSKT